SRMRTKSLEQVRLDRTWRFHRFHFGRERLQPKRQHLFIIQTRRTIVTHITVRQRFRSLFRSHHLAPRQFTHYTLESLTVHAKHLADFTVAEPASSTLVAGLNFASKRARARCKRDRTVPIAQPKISAVSP